ncbi:YraN family protein [Candidatus Microgenomates bacterium]|nr:YraN family protein [Candidatus Microgenomates bacterium]
MTTTDIGRGAEELAADYLISKGFKILTRNWRTRWCEIDIVAQKGQRIHFVEVKYRKDLSHGSGLDYITKTKMRQLKNAALFWVGEKDWDGDYQIDVISVDGEFDPKLTYVSSAIPIN